MIPKKAFLIFIVYACLYSIENPAAFAQSIDVIRSSGHYHWGMGEGSNYSMARRNALENLTESISLHIKSEFEQVVVETNEDVEVYTESVVSTYSSAVINRYEERVLKEEPGNVEVMVYITRANLAEVFKQREQVVSDFIYLGNKAREELRIADALRYYYWALVLTRSHPDNTRLRHDFGTDRQLPVLLTLNDRITSIFSFLRVEINAINENEGLTQKQIYFNLFYRDQPVQDLDYTYWMGDGYSALHSASNGIGYAMLDGAAAREFNSLRMRVEYQYENKAHLEPEVKLMLESVTLPYFERAEIRVPLQAVADSPAPVQVQKVEGREFTSYQQVAEGVLDAIRTGNHVTVRELFTPQGYDMYQKLIANGRVTVMDYHSGDFRAIRVGNEVMLRSIPMLFAFRNNRERFIENVVFTFNEENKIDGLAYALSDVAINDILSKPEGFGSEEEKYFLIKFMEDFKTAYALKRLDYLEAIFDENALIIIGNVVKRSTQAAGDVSGMYGNLTNDQIEYIRLTKNEYMGRLRSVFNRNEFINIRFEDNEVRKTQRDDKIYGIQIAQHYYSSTYADKGYLFLMIDLNDTINPKIYVRTWQPQKNEDGTIYGLEDFRF